MNPFSTRRGKRNTSIVALVVWLFALASGMANACLLEAPGTQTRVGASHFPDTPTHAHAAVALSGDGMAADEPIDDFGASKGSCLKACDDGSNAQVRLQTGLDLTDPVMAPLAMCAREPRSSVVSLPGRFDALQAPMEGPPVRLRYSRLTL